MISLSKMIRWMYTAHAERRLFKHKGCSYVRSAFATTLLVHCSSVKEKKINSIEYPDSSQLSHEHLIQQACTATVNSTSQLLTCTLIALVDVGQQYSECLKDHLSLLEESLSNIENYALQEELTDMITAARNSTAALKKNFLELVSLMDYVETLVNSTTETSFLAGAETACTALSERLYSAKLVINEKTQEIKKLEEELVQLQKSVIVNSHIPET